MHEIIKEIANLFLSIENLSPKESPDSLEIKKHFLNFQIHKLVQLHSTLKECLRELDSLDSNLETLLNQFKTESQKIDKELTREKLNFTKNIQSDMNEFLDNIRKKTLEDSKADQMAKSMLSMFQ